MNKKLKYQVLVSWISFSIFGQFLSMASSAGDRPPAFFDKVLLRPMVTETEYHIDLRVAGSKESIFPFSPVFSLENGHKLGAGGYLPTLEMSLSRLIAGLDIITDPEGSWTHPLMWDPSYLEREEKFPKIPQEIIGLTHQELDLAGKMLVEQSRSKPQQALHFIFKKQDNRFVVTEKTLGNDAQPEIASGDTFADALINALGKDEFQDRLELNDLEMVLQQEIGQAWLEKRDAGLAEFYGVVSGQLESERKNKSEVKSLTKQIVEFISTNKEL